MPLPYSPKLRLAALWPALAAIVAAAATAIVLLPAPLAEEGTRELAHTLALVLPALPAPVAGIAAADRDLQARISTLAAGTGFRVTIVSLDGVVLADTAVAPERLAAVENHRQRPEIAQALARGTGSAHRPSPTTGDDSVYAARLVTGADGAAWVVRLARPIRSLAAARRQLVRVELVAALVAGLTAWLVSLWLTRSLFRPLASLIASADALASGAGRREIEAPDAPELATLARALERLAREKDRQIAAVAAERDHLQATVASMSEGVLVTDAQGVPRLANAAFRRLFGIAMGEAAERALDLARDPRLVDLVAAVLRHSQPAAVDVERLEPAPHTVALLASPLAGNGGAVVLARDLSERERLDRMRRDFVANVSHELRTPLAAIRGCAETLVDGAAEDAATARRFSERILEQCRRLGDLLEDLLTLSRLESTAPVRATEPVALVELAAEAIESVRDRAAAKGVRLALAAPGAVSVVGDAEGLLRLLSNLLDNAIKYNHDGGDVELRVEREDGQAMITVADSGIGIAPLYLPRIFERFYRVDAARSREAGGTGLGLAIVKHVAQAHGGRVEVESELGRGSTFRVILPAG
jgi:two-component system phosphate regulon sensor histidine kinase PhoR